MLEKTGVPRRQDVEDVFPEPSRLAKGPVAVIECFQNIPCNPCEHACPFGAILPFADINDRPKMDESKCNGCGICLTKCPGLAIMVVDWNWSEERALIKLPYEFRPLPEVGKMVAALDREGSVVAQAEVVHVQLNPNMNKVPIVSVALDKTLIKTVRNIAVTRQESSIVCRCNDLDIADIRALIAQGHTSVDELKRVARLGMGPCQGRNCIPIVLGELSRALNIPIAKLQSGTYRPVVKAVTLGELAAYEEHECGCCNTKEVEHE